MSASPPPPDGLDAFRGDRIYLGADHARNERRTRLVAGICALSLIAQVGGGLVFNSMALTAGGLHMAAHLAALLTAAVAYALARRYAADRRFSFGTGKLGYLAGFANAVALALTALFIAVESLHRLIEAEAVDYGPAIWVAALSLIINFISALLLRPAKRDTDLNIGAAYLHLSADVIVSGLAIMGLLAGQMLGWSWADPVAGLLGAVLVARFAWSLIRRAAAVLLDMNPGADLTEEVRKRLASEGEQVIDLHLWRLGPGHDALLAVIAAENPEPPQAYRARLADLGLSHVTVEVRRA